MIQSIDFRECEFLSRIKDTDLFKTTGGIIQLSIEKPNLIVGPNGSGKSTLMQLLSIHRFSDLIGKSLLHSHYFREREYEGLWADIKTWREKVKFLKGFNVKGSAGPAFFYRPDHIPGNETSPTHAMMLGFFDEAKHYSRTVESKSDGQKSSALLQDCLNAFNGLVTPKLDTGKWKNPYTDEWSKMEIEKSFSESTPASCLQDMISGGFFDGTPMVLMDEPEKSLDAKAQFSLFDAMGKTDTSKLQVIVATHSVMPWMNPDMFNFIETVPGYVQATQEVFAGMR